MICRMIFAPDPASSDTTQEMRHKKGNGANGKRPQPDEGPGQVKQSGLGGYSALPALHQLRRDCRAEPFFVALPETCSSAPKICLSKPWPRSPGTKRLR